MNLAESVEGLNSCALSIPTLPSLPLNLRGVWTKETEGVKYVRDGKGLARRRRAEAKRSPEQPGPQATPKTPEPEFKELRNLWNSVHSKKFIKFQFTQLYDQ